MYAIMCLILIFVAIGIYIWARITINRCKNSQECLEQLVNIKNDRIDDLRELASRECISSSCLFMALESLLIKDIEKSKMWMTKREALINEININFNDPSKTNLGLYTHYLKLTQDILSNEINPSDNNKSTQLST